MIQLSYLDYSAVEGKSFLHRFSPGLKIIGMLFVLFIIVTVKNLPGLFLLYAILLTLFFMARVPLKRPKNAAAASFFSIRRMQTPSPFFRRLTTG